MMYRGYIPIIKCIRIDRNVSVVIVVAVNASMPSVSYAVMILKGLLGL
jgi:hypothetical protein